MYGVSFSAPDKYIYFSLIAKKTIGIIAGVIIALLLLIFVFVFVIKREQNERLREKQIEAERIIPRDMRPRKSMMKPKDR